MATLATFMNSINLGLQALQASSQYVKEVQGGEVKQGALGLVQVAGATAAAATNDPEIQAEATLATEIASMAVPILADFIGLFKKKAAAAAVVKSIAGASASTSAAPPAPVAETQADTIIAAAASQGVGV